MHHADPAGVYQPRRVGMMFGCSPGESLTRAATIKLLANAAFMHHADKEH